MVWAYVRENPPSPPKELKRSQGGQKAGAETEIEPDRNRERERRRKSFFGVNSIEISV